MFGYSSPLGTSCLLLTVTLLGTSTFGASINDTSGGDLLSSFAQSKILLMGVLDHNLLVITNDSAPLLYQVPMAKYDKSRIDLYGVVPVELKDKWPMLYSNDNFTKRVLNGEIAQSFSIGMDKESLVFAFHSDNDANALDAVTFTFKPPSATYQQFKIDDDEFLLNTAHFISSDEPNVFFNLKITAGGTTYQLYKFAFNSPNDFKAEWKLCMCKSSNGNDSTGEIVFDRVNSHCFFFDWKIENGAFVYQNRFHLFTKEQVYIFEYTGNSSEVVLKVVKLTDFFVRIIPTTTTTTVHRITTEKASNMMVFIIVAVVGVIGLALVGMASWFFCFKKSPAKNKPDKNSNQKTNFENQNSQVESAVSSEANQNPPPTPKGSSSASAAGGSSNSKGKGSSKAMKTKATKGNSTSKKQAKQAKQTKMGKQAKTGKQSKSKSRSKASNKSASKSSSH